jgi:hypothetical protein
VIPVTRSEHNEEAKAMKTLMLSAAGGALVAALAATPAQAFWGSWGDGPWYGGPWHGGPWYGGYPYYGGYGYPYHGGWGGYPGYGWGGWPGYGYGGWPGYGWGGYNPYGGYQQPTAPSTPEDSGTQR